MTKFCLLIGLVVNSTISAEPISAHSLAQWQRSSDGEFNVIVEAVAVETVTQDKANKLNKSLRANIDEKRTSSMLAGIINAATQLELNAESPQFANPALVSMRVNDTELISLLENPELRVHPNLWHQVALDQSVATVFPSQSSADFVGNGQAVVLLDTGVNAAHTFLSGVINQNFAACFSNDNNGSGAPAGGESLCPDGSDADSLPDGSFIGSQAGAACDASIQGCEHGTNMAGIIAGSNNAINGVAPAATVIPIQVFTKSNDVGVCGDPSLTPCIGALTSDIIRALDYIASIANSTSIAAVNISFGSSALFEGICDNNPERLIIEQLSNMGIAVIASSGNNASSLAMTSPACISSAISVASVGAADGPSSFNNRNSELDFFAPGESINTSSFPLSTFANADGTSAAAAHVAAAWAVLKSENSNASVRQIKNALTNNGTTVTQGLVSAPRINITQSLGQLPSPAPTNGELCFPIRTVSGTVSVICL